MVAFEEAELLALPFHRLRTDRLLPFVASSFHDVRQAWRGGLLWEIHCGRG